MGATQTAYLKQHYKVIYYNYLTSGKLYAYLVDIGEQAEEMFFRLVKELAEKEGITEQLKSTELMEWVRRMNDYPQQSNGNNLKRGGVCMKKRKYYLRLTYIEHRLIIQCLI